MIRRMGAPPDQDDSDDDRRDDPRQPIELKVEYKRLNAFFADYTKNISRGGTFIQTSKPLPIGTEFVFKLYVPALEEPLRIRGEVRWIVDPPAEQPKKKAGAGADEAGDETVTAPPPGGDEVPGMGIRFVYADDEERGQVEQLVERLMVGSLGHLVYRKLMNQDRGGGGGGGGSGGGANGLG
jgi:type IV pilus assembly protein PilZ